MTLLIAISFFLLAGGSFIIIGLSPFDFLQDISKLINKDKNDIRNKIKESRRNKRPKGIKLLISDVKEILKITSKESSFSFICVISMLFFVFGVLIAATMNNVFLIPVLAVGLCLLPFYYIKFTYGKFKKQLNIELETALSMITTSYLRGKGTFIHAVEENVQYLNPPVSEVFKNFLLQTKLINSNTKEAIENLKNGVINDVFHEWVDTVIACQDDYNIKHTLPAIVSKLSDIRIVSSELDILLFEPVKEYITMIILVLSSIPIMYFLNKDWYKVLMFTNFGKVILTIAGTVIFISIAAVSKHTRPIEYKR